MTICFKLVTVLPVVLLASYVASQDLNSTLYSTISGVLVAFTNENVVFTCVARGSNHMGWSSDEYIGTGGRRLEFISTNAPGTNRTSGDTRAQLVSASVDQFIVSQLFISIVSSVPVASVQCQNIGAGTMMSLSFELADNDISITCDKPSVCPGEPVTCVCATGGSNTLAWVVDGSRVAFPSTDPLLARRNVTGTSFAILTDRNNRNGIGVITSNLTAAGSMSGTSLLVQCENVDRSTSNPRIIPVSQNCPNPTETETTTTTAPSGTEPAPSTSVDNTPTIIGLAIFCAIVLLLFVAIVIAAIILVIQCIGLKDENTKKSGQITSLKGENQRLEGENKRLEGENQHLEGENQRLKGENQRLEGENQRLEGTVEKDKHKISQLDGELKRERDQVSRLATECQRLDKKQNNAIENLKSNQQEIKGKDSIIKKLEKEKDKLSAKLREKDTEMQDLKEKHKTEMKKKNSEIKALGEQISLQKKVHGSSTSHVRHHPSQTNYDPTYPVHTPP